MGLFATAPVIVNRRVYARGDELPKLEDSVVADLKDRELASTTNPNGGRQSRSSGSDDSGSGESGEGKLTGEALEAALDERELSKDGTADEKRQRVAEHDAENPPE